MSSTDTPIVNETRPARTDAREISEALARFQRHGVDNVYQHLVQNVADYAIFLLTPQGYIATWNTGAERIKGYTKEEIVGTHFSAFYTPEALATDWPAQELSIAASTGRLEDEGWRVKKDGSRFWANVVITALRGSDGELVGYAKVTRDLTDKRLQEERLRSSERNLRLLIRSVQDYAIYSMDSAGTITSWNVGAERIKGYRAEEIIGKHFSVFYLAQDAERGLPAHGLKRATEEGHFESEGWRVRKDGTRLWASVTITATRDESGQLLGFSKVTRDLTERKRHEEALREREENLRLLVEGVRDHAMFLLDGGGLIRTWNTGAQRLFGYEASQVLGQPVSQFYVDEERDIGRAWTELASAKETGYFQVEGWRQRADGTRFWADISTTHLADDEGNTRGFVRIVRDLTERQRVETLEMEGRRIAEFIAMLSHELRNPLAPIRNAMAILKPLVEKPEAVWCVELVGRQVGHLTRLVDDLLDVSRVTSGKIRLEPVPIELRTLVRMAVEAAKETISGYGHALVLQLGNRPIPIVGDATRLTQVVVNLLNNAAKYTPRGGRIKVSLQEDGRSALLQVADNGIGMTASLLTRAFEPFVQGVRALDRSEGGLGVGLTLVKTIVQLHGGTVAAASGGPGQGSTFTVALPIASESQQEATAQRPNVQRSAPHAKRVLIVDDNKDAAESLALLLQMEGHHVDIAFDGPQALAVAASGRPAVILLDIGLPGMDGYEVARRIRDLPGCAEVKLVALTGYGQDADKSAALAAGFQAHMTKPVDPDELRERLNSLGDATAGPA